MSSIFMEAIKIGWKVYLIIFFTGIILTSALLKVLKEDPAIHNPQILPKQLSLDEQCVQVQHSATSIVITVHFVSLPGVLTNNLQDH
jgi:hypothetical protein